MSNQLTSIDLASLNLVTGGGTAVQQEIQNVLDPCLELTRLRDSMPYKTSLETVQRC
jgi:hypothetical protein